ncbi:hypothetical protein DAEQUDRAFT_725176 [Daedalea quercina L-15889]|uniref:Uncharacterized protein n=1 Tax=Daedalea quercina L-15889 TaxID=1314783 RepID=A0A165RE71_9APHY|nr:hypothetical protein DAEQUDRAFT_725176 [Daedalea quercina L-15889]
MELLPHKGIVGAPSMLPFELLDEIVFWYFHSCIPGPSTPISLVPKDSRSSKPDWHAVQPLTVVSKAFRRLVLEAWFQTIIVRDHVHLVESPPIPEVASWARAVHWINPLAARIQNSPRHELPADAFEDNGSILDRRAGLAALNRIRRLRYDAMNGYFVPGTFKLVGGLPHRIVELELWYHIWPSPGNAIMPIADTFPNLQVLELRQETVWCSLCNTCDVLFLSEAPPPSVVYTNGDGLPKLYNRFLSVLSRLHAVHLSAAYILGGGSSISLQELKTPWRGECGDCTLRLLTDEGFVSEWEVKNKDEPHPPSLREVVWTFTPRKERAVASPSSNGSTTDYDTQLDDEDIVGVDVEEHVVGEAGNVGA